MKKILRLVWLLCAIPAVAQIQSGPMVGYSEMFETGLWVQTQQAAKVKFVYWEQGTTQKFSTAEIQSLPENGFAVQATANQLQPGKKYDYEVWVNNKKIERSYPLSFQSQTLWQYRSDPPAFTFAVGSCFYVNEEQYDRPGKSYGSNYQILESLYKQKPEFMLWIGDNTYMREPDWNTRTGVLHRYTHTRSLLELQPLLGSVHHYATWDDHDYGNNDSDRGFWLKRTTLDVFKKFWVNPNYIFENEGVTGTFFWNDVQFFMMDDRWFRAPNEDKDPNRDYLGQKQLKWLIDALTTSNAPFKIIVVGGQVINPAKVFENYANYEGERAILIKTITDAKIKGVMFFSGDRHHTVLQKLDREGTYPLYDLTVSPLTAGTGKPIKAEDSSPVVDGTLVSEQNFGKIEISGTRLDRVMKINIINAKGETAWTKEIKASELK